MVGLIFVVFGVVFLLNNMDILDIQFDILDLGYIISRFWPALFLILPGLLMHSSFFSGKDKDAGILVPAGIPFTVGVVFQLSITFHIMNLIWPGLILSVAIGLFELYLFGTRDKGLLIPVTILTVISLVFFTSVSLRPLFHMNLSKILIPAILIIAGISFILNSDSK
jgi:hypothetical protein